MFSTILVPIGSVTYYFVAHQIARHFDDTLVTAVDALALALGASVGTCSQAARHYPQRPRST